MTIKPFEIQSSDLVIGGVKLEAGSTTIVIPGVTQAANYFVEEVDDIDDQTYSNFPAESEVVVIDKALYDTIVAEGNESTFADFTATTDDEGYIDDIEVNGQGTYSAANADRASLNDMYAYVGAGSASDRPLVPEDWIQVPFRPKMRAGEIENIGGGGNLEDIQVTRDDEEGETALSLADKDFNIRTTRTDPEQDADIGIYAADDLWLEAAGDDVVISAADEVRINSNNANSSNEWTFNAAGHVVFPDGSVQVTAYIAGTGDNNIWIETFESDQPTTDFVQSAMSVEYDADGNVFALFNHSIPTPNSETYTSVAKLTPAGTVLWQVRFSVNLNTDGWGLAYDTINNFAYIAGRTSGTPLTYEFATLTKINGNDGTVGWSKTYDFEANSSSAVVDVDSDGHPIMVGYAYNGTDNYIVTTKVDQADGSILWSKTIDGQGYDEAYGMAVGPTSEVVTIGYVDQLGTGATDGAATLYTDPVSNPNWVTSTSVSGSSGATYSVSFTDGVPTFTNIVDPVGNRTVDSTLDTISGVSFGGTSPADDMIVKVATLAVNDNADRMVVIKYDTNGNIAWQKAIQFDAGYNCTGADADIDADGNIYVCGQYEYDYDTYTTSAMSLIKFNSSGVAQWSRRVVGNCDTFATSVVVGPDNTLYLSGVTGNDINSDYTWVVAKYDTDGLVVWQRLIDNTTTWTFGGGFWFSSGGGSNIAVGNGYVALAGTFGDPGTQPKATIVQIDTAATEFAVGDWDFKAATFSGVLNGTASDITVVDAGKTTGNTTPTATDFVTSSDSSNFLSVTRAGAAAGDSIDNGAYSVRVGSNGVVTMATSRGSLEFGALPEIGGPTHFHIMKTAGDTADLYLGDDYNYVLQRGPVYGGLPAYGVEIGTNDNDGGSQHVWRFETNGSLTVPGSITRPVDDTLILVTSGTSGTSASVSVDGEFGRLILRTNNGVTTKDWTFGIDGVLTMPGGGSLNVSTPPTNSVGSSGDKAGMIAFDGTAIYYCITDFVEPYTATLIGGSITDYPSVLQGDYPKPLAGWTFVFNTVTYTLVEDATSPNAGQWMLHVDQTISTDNVSIELTPPAANIWVKQAWSTTGSWS